MIFGGLREDFFYAPLDAARHFPEYFTSSPVTHRPAA
jgi:hypothetical protein